MITVTGEYALRAMAYIAKMPEDEYALARNIGQILSIPPNYLSKVLQALARHGLLDSQRGRNGGFRLRKSPDEVSLMDILAAVEPMNRYETCILGHKECTDEGACAIHGLWKSAREEVLTFFRNTPLTELVRRPGALKKMKRV